MRYEESLKIRERLVALTGQSPDALRDLHAVLFRMADLAQASDDPAGARQMYMRCLLTVQAALRQSPLSKDLQDDVERVQARLDALPPDTP